MKAFLQTLFDAQDLGRKDAEKAMDMIMSGDASAEHTAAFLGAMATKDIVVDELVGFATSIRKHMVVVEGRPANTIDVCGTGGDSSGTFNISTATSLVLAGGGVSVAKHGNRSVSSKCGGFDVLEALGVQVEMTSKEVEESLTTTGIGFIFAPLFHPAFKHAASVRKALGVRTVFNMLGPLCNPAGVRRQLLGVYDVDLLLLMAQTLHELGSKEAMIVASEDGLDELSIAGKTQIAHLKNGEIELYSADPSDAGLQTSSLEKLQGGDATENAKIIEDILEGKTSAKRDVVVLNAAAGFMVAGKASDLKEGASLAAQSIDSGAALNVLKTLRRAA